MGDRAWCQFRIPTVVWNRYRPELTKILRTQGMIYGDDTEGQDMGEDGEVTFEDDQMNGGGYDVMMALTHGDLPWSDDPEFAVMHNWGAGCEYPGGHSYYAGSLGQGDGTDGGGPAGQIDRDGHVTDTAHQNAITYYAAEAVFNRLCNESKDLKAVHDVDKKVKLTVEVNRTSTYEVTVPYAMPEAMKESALDAVTNGDCREIDQTTHSMKVVDGV